MFTAEQYSRLEQVESDLKRCGEVLETFFRRYNLYGRPKFSEKDEMAVKLVSEHGKIMSFICKAAFYNNDAAHGIAALKEQMGEG